MQFEYHRYAFRLHVKRASSPIGKAAAMNSLYFACDWPIRFEATQVMWQVIDVAFELGCTIFNKGILETSEGIYVSGFVIQTPSLEKLNIFIEKAGSQIGLTTWYLVEQEQDLDEAYNIEASEARLKFILDCEYFGKINDLRRGHSTNSDWNDLSKN